MSSASTPPLRKQAVLRDRLFVPGEYVTEAMLDYYKSEVVVGESPILDEWSKPTGKTEKIFDTINHYQINYLSQDKIIYSFNRGDMARMRQIFHDFEIIDERIDEPMKAKLKIRFPTGKNWRKYQPDAIEAMLQHDYGMLKAPPRSGKTLMIAANICLERQKSIIFAHQTDLLVQLYDTFCEYTNLLDLQTPGNPIVGFAETIEDFDNLDVVLCTKQTFDHISNKPMLGAIQKMFGSVYIDEVHFMAADVYSKLINRFWAKTRRGVTATPKRKDGLNVVAEGVLGDLIHEIHASEVNQAPVEVMRVNTGLKLALKNFTKILNVLAESKSRNELIVRHMVADVKAGRTIIAVTDRKQHQKLLQELLAKQGIACELFNGSTNNKKTRKKILNRIRNKEVPILLSMRSMTTGLDIPCADTFYNLMPSSNAVKEGEYMGEGGYQQQCTRVRTEYPGKTKCFIKDFVDSFGAAYNCWNERRKTYDLIGATVLRMKDDEPEVNPMFSMDDGLGGL